MNNDGGLVLPGHLGQGGVQEARVYDGYKNAFPFGDINVVNKECGKRASAYMEDCPECNERVALHCDQCKIQVTGCTCTDTVIHGRDYALKARATRPSHGAGMNRAQRRQAARKRNPALWTPNNIHQ